MASGSAEAGEELVELQAELVRVQAQNRALEAIAATAIGLLNDDQRLELRAELARLDAGEGAENGSSPG